MADDIESRMAALLARVHENVTTSGLSVQMVFPNEETNVPWLVYTIGMETHGLPNMLIFGIDGNSALHILNDIASMARAGKIQLKDGQIVSEAANMPVLISEPDQSKASMFGHMAQDYAEEHGRSTTFVQVIFPDKDGFYPNDPRCSPNIVMLQNLDLHYAAEITAMGNPSADRFRH
jgi:hypothetical protein